MIKAVFLDLDATLLHIDTDLFVREFVIGMSEAFLKHYPALADLPFPVAKASQQAVRAVTQNLDPTRTNAQIFSESMTAALGLSADEMQVIVEDFQGAPYALLGKGTSRVEGARSLIEHLEDMGLSVVIATNPLFNLNASMHRLPWAGLHHPH